MCLALAMILFTDLELQQREIPQDHLKSQGCYIRYPARSFYIVSGTIASPSDWTIYGICASSQISLRISRGWPPSDVVNSSSSTLL